MANSSQELNIIYFPTTYYFDRDEISEYLDLNMIKSIVILVTNFKASHRY